MKLMNAELNEAEAASCSNWHHTYDPLSTVTTGKICILLIAKHLLPYPRYIELEFILKLILKCSI